MRLMVLPVVGCLLVSALAASDLPVKPARPQYKFERILIPAASADEPLLEKFSLTSAAKYLDDGAAAWTGQRKCVSCHTNGIYLEVRPSLSGLLGTPPRSMRQFFCGQLDQLRTLDHRELLSGIRPTQIALIARGLAEWDVHVERKLTPETDAALRTMFDVQSEDGSWNNQDCWPPLESSSYHGTTVAAMAAATAPGWLAGLSDSDPVQAKVKKLKSYLRQTKPRHDYARLCLLAAATRMDGLVDDHRRAELIAAIWKHQHQDGGWSIRDFSAPEHWGRGNRAAKLRAEIDFAAPASDAYQTGLCVVVLRDAGIAANDSRIQKAAQWLMGHQRQSGRWWTRSLNTDGYHFISYSGSCYALLALAKCNMLR